MSDNPKNEGHGHVRPRPDGIRARCGGPMICSVCALEQAQLLGATLSPGGGFNVRNQQIEEHMRTVARQIKSEMPDGWGFTVLMFNYGENKEQTDGLFYISSADRDDMIRAMKEFIARNEN